MHQPWRHLGPSLRRTWYKFYVGLALEGEFLCPHSTGWCLLDMLDNVTTFDPLLDKTHISLLFFYDLLCFGLVQFGKKRHMMCSVWNQQTMQMNESIE